MMAYWYILKHYIVIINYQFIDLSWSSNGKFSCLEIWAWKHLWQANRKRCCCLLAIDQLHMSFEFMVDCLNKGADLFWELVKPFLNSDMNCLRLCIACAVSANNIPTKFSKHFWLWRGINTLMIIWYTSQLSHMRTEFSSGIKFICNENYMVYMDD